MAAHLVKKTSPKFRKWLLKNMWLWPPYIGAGIKVDAISDDFLTLQSSLNLTWFNKNYVGTHFGGSIYSMTDPFYMLMLLQNLGKDYIVWDMAANIRFKRPGKGKITAKFEYSTQEIQEIKSKADSQDKYVFDKQVLVKDEQGDIVAEITKTLYVKKKPK